ncbi:sensor histidine kinase [Cellulomonas dongxiuzhuiae]|uniref:histidine kinase n=1 Tax=Cellulomonas dongxiuzhuiae TaxID=2819979 RepID=A0ABX8GGY9_9CELL|nr:ATP-binding protein [Cellulomonas dongxiuzhuiae]MBO3088548.1 hypothetical protein [Cellulomonas dongxiuzhuiae]MBO3094119.1 hypothetical protein [Cellulomonas dongxiuzhuiae]QWC15183.1 hypothetical protein KKR89_12720 [Cellulomonas dongxiuzhuiae]
MTSSDGSPAATTDRADHLAIGRVVRLLSEVRLAVLVVCIVSGVVKGGIGLLGAGIAVLAMLFSVMPARSWEQRGELFSRSGILLACDLVVTVVLLVLLPGELMMIYAAATVALFAAIVGTRLALFMATPIAMALLGAQGTSSDGLSWLVVATGAVGVLAMAWAGNALGAALRAQEAAARRAATGELRRAATLERVRIARELHDTVAGDLAGATMLGRTLVDRLVRDGADPRTLTLARRLAESCATAHTHTRVALGELRRAEMSPVEELTATVVDWSERTGVRTSVRVAPAVEDIPAPVSSDLRAILLELLENVRRHAAARRVDVVVELAGDTVRLVVVDDGRGIPDLEHVPADDAGHYGLRGIDERAQERAGSVRRSTPPGGGLRTEVVLRTDLDVEEVAPDGAVGAEVEVP